MVSSVKLITNEMVEHVLKYEKLIPAIERGLKDFSNGTVVQPLRSVIHLQQHNGYFLSMPAYVSSQDILAVKHVALYPNNSVKNLASHICQMLLYDSSTGCLKALMDAELITEMRTAAASVVATKYLVAGSPTVLAVLGAGRQAHSHILALTSQFDFDQVFVWNRTRENGEKLCRDVASFVKSIQLCNSVEEAVKNADVIVTATTSQVAVLHGEHLKEGVHINCIGGVRPEWREMDDECLRLCDVYVDTRTGALSEAGDIVQTKKEIIGEIGELISGSITADRNKRTIFKSLGIAVEDAVTAELIWKNLQHENQ